MDCKKAHVSLELGRKLIELHPELKDWVESKVPELKESNENIRLYMINMIKSIRYNSTVYGWFQDGKDEEMLNWLETHKEENTSDKPKSKFKVGDWITNGDKIEQISEVDNYYYRCFNGNHGYGVYLMDIESTDADFHLWTIKDAKDGDTLTYYLDNGKALIMIYEGLGDSYNGQVYCHALLDGDRFSESVGSVCCEYIWLLNPSTKEQHELLYKKMEEKGYYFDEDEKIIKGIKQDKDETADKLIAIAECLEMDGDCSFNGYSGNECGKFLRELSANKILWNEEDEKMASSIIEDTEQGCILDDTQLKWIKLLKEKINKNN